MEPSGYPSANSSVVLPSITAPSSSLLTPTPTETGADSTETFPVEATGAASHLKSSFGVAAGVAGLFFML